MRIPFCPVPLKRAKSLSKKFFGISGGFLKASPRLKEEIKQAGFPLDEREYMAIAFFSAIFMFLLTFISIFAVAFVIAGPLKALSISLLVGMMMFFVTIFYIRKYPALVIKKRVRQIDANLANAMRHMYIQVKAGVTIFDALLSVSMENYGVVSEEFRQIVKDANTGTSLEKAIEDSGLRNPSYYYRRAIWQIANGIKAGSDVGNVLGAIIENMTASQKIAIRKYGSQLNPLTLVYMMIAVIIPSMGVTFLIVLSTFSGISVSELMFWVILGFVSMFQFMFIGMIKSKRPTIV